LLIPQTLGLWVNVNFFYKIRVILTPPRLVRGQRWYAGGVHEEPSS
jgi:hypothetical protein